MPISMAISVHAGYTHRHLTIYIDCFLGSFCYIRTVFRLICLTAQPSYEGRAAVHGGGGANSISEFHHHSINGGAVDNT
jgi:hypothetical protein